MTDREKVIKALECCAVSGDKRDCDLCPIGLGEGCALKLKRAALALLKAQEPITGETSDGYHTFNELYHHRAVLFSVIVNNYKGLAWKSVRHHDGTMYDGMFIVGIDTPDGQATYHYDINPYWDMFKCRVREFAPEWDGHTPAQAIERIGKLKAQEPRVMTWQDVIGAAIECKPLYIEVKDSEDKEPGDDRWAMVTQYKDSITNGMIRAMSSYITSEILFNEWYGKTWRCWTSRPDEKRRAETPWN